MPMLAIQVVAEVVVVVEGSGHRARGVGAAVLVVRDFV